jgi:hypothetical protein
MPVTPKITKLPIKSNGIQVVQATFSQKKQFTRDEVKKISQQYSNELKKKNFKGTLMVSIHFNNQLGFRNAKGSWLEPGEKIKLFKASEYEINDDVLHDPEKYSSFLIYIKK